MPSYPEYRCLTDAEQAKLQSYAKEFLVSWQDKAKLKAEDTYHEELSELALDLEYADAHRSYVHFFRENDDVFDHMRALDIDSVIPETLIAKMETGSQPAFEKVIELFESQYLCAINPLLP